MAEFLAPKLSGGVAYEQPVAPPPTALSAVGSLLGVFVPKEEDVPHTERRKRVEDALRVVYANSLQDAEDLRRQGFTEQARDLERKAKIEAAKGGLDLGSSEITELTESITGIPAERVGFSPEEVAFRQAVESPEFQSAFLATYATNFDATESERFDLAFNSLKQREANTALIETTKFNWNTGQGRESRLSLIQDWRDENLGGLVISGKQGIKITNDIIQQARINFQTLQVDIVASRPANLSADEWKPIEDSLVATQKQLEYLETLTSKAEISSDAARGFTEALDNLYQEGGITAMERNVMVNLMLERPETLVEQGVIDTSRFKDILEATARTSIDDLPMQDDAGNGFTEDGSSFSKEEKESVIVGKADVTRNFERAKAVSDTGYGMRGSERVGDRSAWVVATNRGLANLRSMAADHDAWLTAEGYREVFTPNFFRNLEEVRRSGNDYTYTSVYNKTSEAIDANITALRAGIQSRTKSDIVQYDPATNKLVMNLDAFRESTIIPEVEKTMFYDLVTRKYGGDFDAAIRDRGSNLPSIYRIAHELADEDVIQRIDAIDQLNGIKGRLVAPEPAITGGAGDTELPGSAGSDVLAPEDFTGDAAQLLREFEGFRETPYWDVNAYRVGYGSDTITKADGSVIKVTEGMTVSKEDAERDLRRRTQEFADIAKRQVGSNVWTSMPTNVTSALTSIAYNYGRLPDRILDEAKSGDWAALATAVEELAGDNKGINRDRRTREAAIIRGKATAPTAAPIYTERPEPRPTRTAGLDVPQRATERPVQRPAEVSTETPTVEGEKITPEGSQTLRAQTTKLLNRLGMKPEDVPSFDNEDAVRQALAAGDIKEGDVVIINGQVVVL